MSEEIELTIDKKPTKEDRMKECPIKDGERVVCRIKDMKMGSFEGEIAGFELTLETVKDYKLGDAIKPLEIKFQRISSSRVPKPGCEGKKWMGSKLQKWLKALKCLEQVQNIPKWSEDDTGWNIKDEKQLSIIKPYFIGKRVSCRLEFNDRGWLAVTDVEQAPSEESPF